MQEMSNNQRQTWIACIARWWWRVGSREGRAEPENFRSDEFRRVALDVQVDPKEVRSMVGKWPDSANLAMQWMSALGLNAAEIAESRPAVSIDLERVYTPRIRQGRGEREFTIDAKNSRWEEYYPNVTTLTAQTVRQVAEAGHENT